MPAAFEFGGTSLTIRIQDELGRIDLNRADGSLLQGAGVDPHGAEILADRVLDWRDPAAAHRLNGATAEGYRTAGLPYHPRRHPFRSVEALRLVLGMTPDLFERIAPAVTIWSQRANFDPATVPSQALRALPGMDGQKVADLVAERERGGDLLGRSSIVRGGVIDPQIPLGGRAFAIHAAFEIAGMPYSCGEVVRLTGSGDEPYWVLAKTAPGV